MLNQITSLDRVFHALGDPTRREMVERLSRGPATVKQLAEPYAMSLPAVLQHLKVLEASGLVTSEKVGRVRTCRIERVVLGNAGDWIAQRQASWERCFDALADYLAATANEQDKES